MASSVTSLFLSTLKSLYQDNSTVIRNIVTVLLVFGLEAIITSENLFECPAKGYAAYSWMFIFGPGGILFVISLALNSSFEKHIRGCCYSEEGNSKTCHCSLRPRWGCTKKIGRALFYSCAAGCLWVFWAFFQGEYFTCAMLGNKEVRTADKTEEEKKEIESDYAKMNGWSQKISIGLLSTFVILPFMVLFIYRCCCQPPKAAIPSVEKYEKREAESAEKAFKEKIERLADERGKRKAEKCFSKKLKAEKSPSFYVEEVYEDLRKSAKEHSSALPNKEEFKTLSVQAAIQAFETRLKNSGEEKMIEMIENKAWKEFEDNENPKSVIQEVIGSMVNQYPRSTGDPSKPYIIEIKRNQNARVQQPRADQNEGFEEPDRNPGYNHGDDAGVEDNTAAPSLLMNELKSSLDGKKRK